MKKQAFTLAEVLITLGIIGIVAAMTLPGLIQNYQKKVTVNRLKAAYTVMINTFERAKADFGPGYEDWQGTTNNKDDFDFLYNTYIKPYLITYDKKNGQICRQYSCKTPYKILSGADMYQHDWSGSFRLKNGVFIHIHPYHCGIGRYSDAIYIDINGPEHGPNVLGKDTFDFMTTIGRSGYSQKNGILTTSCEGLTRAKLIEKCSRNYDGTNCSATGATSCCSALIMSDGWEIKDDYPW